MHNMPKEQWLHRYRAYLAARATTLQLHTLLNSLNMPELRVLWPNDPEGAAAMQLQAYKETA